VGGKLGGVKLLSVNLYKIYGRETGILHLNIYLFVIKCFIII